MLAGSSSVPAIVGGVGPFGGDQGYILPLHTVVVEWVLLQLCTVRIWSAYGEVV